MIYRYKDVTIAVEQIDGFGKYPGLWLGTDQPNEFVKVASFGNERKAKAFCKWFEYIVGLNDDRKAVKWE